MADEKFTFEQAKVRLEEIASEVRKKDTSLERSLDLLEEGVRLANICTELVDHTDLDARVTVSVSDAPQGADTVGKTDAAGEQIAENGAGEEPDAPGVDLDDRVDEDGSDADDVEIDEPSVGRDED
ncbi:MAG: exodeoxyribonuclease VII small subunit [Coriobacteriia bacterium]|nr:exodeoxyribonuclease VII small subunit [Coriobacteriia bacterium]